MMVRVDDDLARAVIMQRFSVTVPQEEYPPQEEDTDIIYYTPRGPVRVRPQKRNQRTCQHEVELAADLVPDWLADLIKEHTTITMPRKDFYGLPEEVRRYVRAL